MSDIAARRRELRLALRSRREELSDDDLAAAAMAVTARLVRVAALRRAEVVAGYRAVRGEVDVDAVLTLLIDAGATVTVPRVVGEHLQFVEWHPGDPAEPGSFGIPEPRSGRTVPLTRHDVVLAPLVAFDAEGQRLGQGGGFYDRALAGPGDAKPLVIGVAHAFQRVEQIPVEPWDVPLDAVVTEDEVVEFRPGCLDPGI